MASEPLTGIEVEYPDPKERQAVQRLEPVAEALGLSLSVLCGTSNNADTRVDATQALVSKLRALFGDQCNMAAEPRTEGEATRTTLKHTFGVEIPHRPGRDALESVVAETFLRALLRALHDAR